MTDPDPRPEESPPPPPPPDPPPAPLPEGTAPLPGEKAAPAPVVASAAKAPVAPRPWGTIVLLALTVFFVAVALSGRALDGRPIHLALGLKKELHENPLEAWRLVTSLFVYGFAGLEIFLLATTAFSLGGPFSGGARTTERLLGTGPMLFVFLVGGAAANVARVLYEPVECYERVQGGYAGALALLAAAFVATLRTRDPTGVSFTWLLSRTVLTLSSLLLARGVLDPAAVGTKVPEVFPGIAAALGVGAVLGLVLPTRPSPVRPVLGLVSAAILALALVGVATRFGKNLLELKVDPEAALEETELKELGLRLKLPRGYLKGDSKQKHVAVYASVLDLPQVRIMVVRQQFGMLDSDTLAERRAREYQKELGATLEDGPRALPGTSYRAHYIILSIPPRPGFGNQQVVLRNYVILSKAALIEIAVFHGPDDDTAQGLADSVAKSVTDLSDK